MEKRVQQNPGGETGDLVAPGEYVLTRKFAFPSEPREIEAYMKELKAEGLALTSLEDEGRVAWKPSETKDGICCEVLTAAGAEIGVLRHSGDFDAPASLVFDLYNHLNYTDTIDPYTQHIDHLEELDMSASSDVSWASVVWTVDQMFPFPDPRDYVTLDVCFGKDLLFASRSVAHPTRPVAPKSSMGTFLSYGNTDYAYRVPLVYYLAVRPKGRESTVTQIHYCDLGGYIPAHAVLDGTKKIGFDNMVLFRKLVAQAMAQKMKLGIGSELYLAHPLKPSWRQSTNAMVPGLIRDSKVPQWRSVLLIGGTDRNLAIVLALAMFLYYLVF